jgi:hypothetical protein
MAESTSESPAVGSSGNVCRICGRAFRKANCLASHITWKHGPKSRAARMVGKNCEHCGGPIGVKRRMVRYRETRFCSRGCSHAYHVRERSVSWRGGRTTNKFGYVMVHAPAHPAADNRNYVGEHRIVLEAKLGRLLEANEVPHHLNGIKDDNRPENLVAMDHSEHRRLHATHRRRIGVRYSRDELLHVMRGWIAKHGRNPTYGEWVGLPHRQTYLRRFGSWPQALAAAAS